MNKKTTWLIAVIVVIIIIIILATSGSSTKTGSTDSAKTIKIGIVAPLTGGGSAYGINLVKGAELAIKDLKDTENTYQLVVEDDETTPAKSASAAQKLVSIDKVSALITVTSGTGNAVKQIATAAKIPNVCDCVDTRITDEYNFTNGVMPDEEAAAWVQEAASQGVKKVAILSQNQPGFNLLTDEVKKQVSAAGITVVFEERSEPTIKDFKTLIAKARQTKPDIYLVAFFPPQLDIIGQEFKALGITNISGMGTFATAADPSVFNGEWYTDASLADPAFKTAYAAAYPDQRFNVRAAPQGYDAVPLIVWSLEADGDTDQIPAGYLRNLLSFAGKSGILTKEAGSSIFHAPIGIWKIQDGQAVQIK